MDRVGNTGRGGDMPAESRLSDGMSRRDFLALSAFGTAGAMVGGGDSAVTAGPFEESDYLKLIPADKKLDPRWIESLFSRGKPKESHSGVRTTASTPVRLSRVT